MHETVFVKDIIKQAKRQGKVEGIVIEVGSLAPIDANNLENLFKELVNWKVKINQKQAIVICECGYKGKPALITRSHDFVLFKCPWCGDFPKVIEGDKIILKEVKCA